jgi:hypothetical protein
VIWQGSGGLTFGVFQAGLADPTASSLPDSIVPGIQALPGVAAASPIQIVSGAVSDDSSILLFGAEPDSFLTRRLVLVSGHEPQGAQLFVGVRAASRLHITPGRMLVVAGHALPVAGIYRSGISLEDAGVELPLASTQQLSRRQGELSLVSISIAPGYRDIDVERAVERAIPGTLALCLLNAIIVTVNRRLTVGWRHPRNVRPFQAKNSHVSLVRRPRSWRATSFRLKDATAVSRGQPEEASHTTVRLAL